MFKKLNKKGIALLISAVLILSVAVGTTIAFLVDSTEDVTDNFTPAKVACTVIAPTDSDSNWYVRNDSEKGSNIDAYIRVAVIFNEENADGTLKWNGAIDATITHTGNWQKVENYYYYKGAVEPGKTNNVKFGTITVTKIVIDENGEQQIVDITKNAKIQVLAEAIQSTPDDAVQTAWGVNYKEQNVWETMKN